MVRVSLSVLAFVPLAGCFTDVVNTGTPPSSSTGPAMPFPPAEDRRFTTGDSSEDADGTGAESPDDTTGDAEDPERGSSSTTGTLNDDADNTSSGGREPEGFCGDGVVDDGEQCDDGGPSRRCDADCTSAMCGDGVVNADAGETCDDAGFSATCDADCTSVACGDGTTNLVAGEDCDTGEETAACDTDCTVATCGDGVLNLAAGEFCDGEASCASDCQSCSAFTPVPVFVADFAGDTSGWTTEGEWAIGPAVGSEQNFPCGFGDPDHDHSSTNDDLLAGAAIGGAINSAPHPFHYLTSPAIDTSGLDMLTLSFQRWLNSDAPGFMTNHVQVFDGVQWVTVWQNNTSIADATWTPQSFDLAAYANPMMRVRFGFAIEATGAFVCSGWNVDDVRIDTYVCA